MDEKNTKKNDPQTSGKKRPSGEKPSDKGSFGKLSRIIPDEREIEQFFHDLFSPKNIKQNLGKLRVFLKTSVRDLVARVFYSKERILCGVIVGVILMLLALLQTTVFSTIRPFGAVPDLMLSFTLALSVTEGRKWGAIWGIVAAVVIESLGTPDVMLLPLLYMPVGFFCGVLCQYYYTGSMAVRTVLTLAVIPIRGIFTAIYLVLSPLNVTVGEMLLDVILPEAVGTLVLAIPIHLLLYLCMKPFHHTRAEMVSGK